MDENKLILMCKGIRSKGKMSTNKIKCINYFSNGSNKCESNILFLTLNHPDDDGWVHKKLSMGNIAGKLVRDNYKSNFRIIVECYNCNLVKERNGGRCPHVNR